MKSRIAKIKLNTQSMREQTIAVLVEQAKGLLKLGDLFVGELIGHWFVLRWVKSFFLFFFRSIFFDRIWEWERKPVWMRMRIDGWLWLQTSVVGVVYRGRTFGGINQSMLSLLRNATQRNATRYPHTFTVFYFSLFAISFIFK